jgi:hypothetical protein
MDKTARFTMPARNLFNLAALRQQKLRWNAEEAYIEETYDASPQSGVQHQIFRYEEDL